MSTSSLTQPRTGAEGRGGSCPGRRSQVLSLADVLPHGTASWSREPRAVGPAARPPGWPAPRQCCEWPCLAPGPCPVWVSERSGHRAGLPRFCRLTNQRDSQSRPASCPISVSLRDRSLPSAGRRSGGGVQGGCARVWGSVLHTPCPWLTAGLRDGGRRWLPRGLAVRVAAGLSPGLEGHTPCLLADRWFERRWQEVASPGPGSPGGSGPEPRPRGEERSIQVGTRGGEVQVDGPPADPACGPGGLFPGRAHCASGGSWPPAEALS